LHSSENETFNTLKNQGYNSEPNYGQVKQNLATILALLMFMAFAIDQMMQRCWRFPSPDQFGQADQRTDRGALSAVLEGCEGLKTWKQYQYRDR
jgi:hypothetical protein